MQYHLRKKLFLVAIGCFVFGALFFASAHSAKAAGGCDAIPATPTNGAILYWDKDCGGDSASLDFDDATNPLHEWKTFISLFTNFLSPAGTTGTKGWNDKTSSIIVKGNVSASFFYNDQLSGKSICWNGPDTKIPNLGTWDEEISSVEIKNSPDPSCLGTPAFAPGAVCVPWSSEINYVCKGPAPTTAPKLVLISGTDGYYGNCASVCQDAKGSTLQFGDGTTTNPYQSYCYGAIKDGQTCTTDASKTNLDVKTGIITTMPTQKECTGPFAFLCWSFNGLFNLVSGFLDKVIAGPIAELTQYLAGLIEKGLQKVIEYFMAVPVSPNGATGFVKIAWEKSRDIANSFLILILAFLGFATILSKASFFQSYELRKTLPALIIVALLINFSGVFVGLIVDASNIVTNAFLRLAAGAPWTSVSQNIPSFGSAQLGLDIVRIIYNLLSLFVFLGITVAFGLRTIVLWTISILSPIALGLYILPSTRKWFNDWWRQLIQWSTFVIPISFFMYLASLALTHGTNTTGLTAPGALPSLLAPFTALLLLATGLGMSMQMAPAAAKKIMDWSQKQGANFRKYAAGQTLGRALATKKGNALAKRLAGSNFGGNTLAGKILGAPMRWGIRQAGKQALQYGAQQSKNPDEEAKKLETAYGKDYESAIAASKSTGAQDFDKRIGLLLYLAKIKGGKALAELEKQNSDLYRKSMEDMTTYASSRVEDVVKHASQLLNKSIQKRDNYGNLIKDTQGNPITTLNPLFERMVSAMISNKNALEEEEYIDENNHPRKRSKNSDVQAILKDRKDALLVANAIVIGTDQYGNETIAIKNDQQSVREVARWAAIKKATDAMKVQEIENMDSSAMENAEFREAIARWKPFTFIKKIGEEWGAEMVQKLQSEAEQIGLEKIALTNSSFIRAIRTPDGQLWMRNWDVKKIQQLGMKQGDDGETANEDFDDLSNEKQLKSFMRQVREKATGSPPPNAPGTGSNSPPSGGAPTPAPVRPPRNPFGSVGATAQRVASVASAASAATAGAIGSAASGAIRMGKNVSAAAGSQVKRDVQAMTKTVGKGVKRVVSLPKIKDLNNARVEFSQKKDQFRQNWNQEWDSNVFQPFDQNRENDKNAIQRLEQKIQDLENQLKSSGIQP